MQRARTARGGVAVPAAQRTTKSAKTITDAPALPGWKVAPFPLRNVAITSNSVFDRAKEGMLDYARNYPVDRWLVCFRAQANLLPKDNTTQPSGGWENFPSGSLDKAVEQQWGDAEYTRGQNKNGADGLLRGHFAGHALHMLSQAYAETGEEAILNKINEFVSGLKECRDSLREMKYNGKAATATPASLPPMASGSSRHWRNMLPMARFGHRVHGAQDSCRSDCRLRVCR